MMGKVYVVKTRAGKGTYVKDDGKRGTGGKGALVGEDVAFTLGTAQDQTLVERREEWVVRRLMPVECERLQALPDGWTDLTGCDVDAVTGRVAAALGYEEGGEEWRKLRSKVSRWSKETPDAPRYRAVGNSITTYAIEMIGRRIQAFDELHYDEVGL